MKWRIIINWEFISPSLGTASGILHLERFDKGMAIDPPEESYSFTINVRKGVFGVKGIIPHLKPEIEGIINSMAKCYLDGLTLKDSSCHWIEEDDIIEKGELWMSENMMSPDHKATNEKYREHYDETFRKNKKTKSKNRKNNDEN